MLSCMWAASLCAWTRRSPSTPTGTLLASNACSVTTHTYPWSVIFSRLASLNITCASALLKVHSLLVMHCQTNHSLVHGKRLIPIWGNIQFQNYTITIKKIFVFTNYLLKFESNNLPSFLKVSNNKTIVLVWPRPYNLSKHIMLTRC